MPLEADPPINCDPPALAEMQAVVRKLKGGKAPGMCGIYGEFVKAGYEAVEDALYIFLCSAWNTCRIRIRGDPL